jgi:hypothetical protein
LELLESPSTRLNIKNIVAIDWYIDVPHSISTESHGVFMPRLVVSNLRQPQPGQARTKPRIPYHHQNKAIQSTPLAKMFSFNYFYKKKQNSPPGPKQASILGISGKQGS